MRQVLEITNWGNFRGFKLGQKDYKSGQGLQIGTRGISKWGRDYKSMQNTRSVVTQEEEMKARGRLQNETITRN